MVEKNSYIIRTDSSATIGTGHVIRCLTLAGELKKKGSSISFICREHPGNICEIIEQRGFPVNRIPYNPCFDNQDLNIPHANWLGATWQEDAYRTIDYLKSLKSKPDWIIVDHYALDFRWESAIRPYVKKIFVIDDLADRIHDCDLLLDQNLFPEPHSRYEGKIPTHSIQLLGPDYAILQPEYAELHSRIPPREGPVKRILIYFGGYDNANITGLTLEALIRLNRSDVDVDVVVSSKNPHINHIKELGRNYTNIHYYYDLPTLAPLMGKADLAIGAAGTTTWERLCLGLPSIVITLAENQLAIAHSLQQQGLGTWLGNADTITSDLIKEEVNSLIDLGELGEWSVKCSQTVDGLGAVRVYTALTISPDTMLRVRRATLSDEKLLLTWVNDPLSRQNSFSMEKISPDTHHQWFFDKLRDLDDVSLYIVETEDLIPVGQVRFDRFGEVWEIDYSLAAEFRNHGVGRSLLKAGLCEFRREHIGSIVLGRVKEENIRSCNVFESLNFSAESDGGGWRISVSSDAGSWMNEYIPDLLFEWIDDGHEVIWAHDAADLPPGDMCFFLSYGKIVKKEILMRHHNNLVVHESNLPKGRGWSPLTWQILEGADTIQVTLFEAADEVDSGSIYLQEEISFDGSELVDELRREQARATISLCLSFVKEYPAIIARAKTQVGTPTYYFRRYPKDSQIDLDRTIREQINLFRVVDNQRYPAWFEFGKDRYNMSIQRDKPN
ncbi:UDP-2,4-diacetamido-2,4,6-trideoxy-beta-L-altropyranose hydrolase [Methanospirillum sp. J.3.6.1-F.2.7.3]|uniref:UDP-2,4-diacetamido-2,4, 6-trideoxy-beta-L-altropyranose hydrolase n=1 Tax=Methanospirillum purgamenti TaxID=2834276 RepID=A0A8E7AZL7_9EURY|nr:MULTISPECIES: UDP-2,4-diacetamido-2,4,6-trideoxy-beta-L-altropyranose hydrolase [Methanospirillum]MDX8549494.1 UDP-2,4-diacetamido-2,4,6-trideoxy-beta-L-altropyranose hydrolase [Methanospirillum hungatei]QVV89224.1 UDP-2,4-diacetamido-2,4,6-trideoxy-beta-L-altropyranose hydrolase [Methanospirillum sp. J.3.6.1-F.2.7.3]